MKVTNVRQLLGHLHQPVCFTQLYGCRAVTFCAEHEVLSSFCAVRYIASDLCEADKLVRRVAHRIHHHAGPQTRSILAYAPAFGLKPSGGSRNLERTHGRTRADIVVPVKDAEIRTDDFLRAIALDTLRARIPTFHGAVEIEQVNRIVDDAVDEHLRDAAAVFAADLAQRGAHRYIASDRCEADKLVRRVAHRIHHHAGPQTRSILAYAPAFGLKPSGGSRNLERTHGRTRADIVVPVKDAEIRTDDLLHAIALDALCARIPTFHVAVEIEQVNRIVDDAVDEHLRDAAAVFAADHAQRGTHRYIASDRCEADKLVRRVAHRIHHHAGPQTRSILAYA